MPRFLFALPLALAFALTLPAADWYQFRGPTGQDREEARRASGTSGFKV